jgi:transcriptional regulator with XRE-family HTH domain
MAKSDSARKEYERIIRKYIKSLLNGGVSRGQMCEALGVTRQAISSYVIGRTTPKPHLVRRLFSVWPTELVFGNTKFGPEAFGAPQENKPKAVALQSDLFAALSSAKPHDLKIEVKNEVGAEEVELRFSLRIANRR